MGRIGCVRCEKSRCDFMARTFVLIAPVHPILHRVSSSYETIPNAPKHYATHQNMSSGPMGLIGCIHCEKFRRDFVARTFVLIAPVNAILHRVSCSYGPKCTQTLCNAPNHEFRVPWGGLGAFVAKNPNLTSWHELLY